MPSARTLNVFLTLFGKPLSKQIIMVEKRSIKDELEKTKEDLADLEMYIEEFSTFLPLAVCTVNPVERIIDINSAFENLTGYKSIEIVGESVEKIFPKNKIIAEILKETQGKKYVKGKEIVLLTREKKELIVSLHVSKREDNEGNFIGYFLGMIDISELKKLQEEMENKVKERTKQLQERVEELERFKRLTEGREMRMVELKKEIKELKEELEKQKGRK